ncbi:MAG: recombination-associated protein RdgC [Pseudomonadales bacterium]|nr:recombination-associated protein RdgC [Pseudomonadales bacterium]
MWFKNLRIYRFTQAFELSPEELQPLLQEKAFHPCGRQDLTKYGWVAPIASNDADAPLVHSCNGNFMLCAQRQDKVVPASVIKEAVLEKTAFIEQKEARKVFSKERAQIKDEVLLDLLPRAFTKNQTIYGYIAPKQKLLLLDASSPSKAEQFLSHLRDSLGSLPVIPPACKNLPGDVMTNWLSQQSAEPPFVLEKECELNNPADSANVIRCKAQDLDADEVQTMLESGKRCSKLAVNWNDSVEAIICDDLSLKRLRFDDKLIEEANEAEAEDKAQQFDQDFAVMALQLNQLCKDLFKAFGGLERTRVV